MMPSAAPLDYAPGRPRRGIIRRVVLAAFLLAAICGASGVAPPLWRHAEYRYWQGQCLRYEFPSDAVVFDDDPSRFAALSAAEPAAFKSRTRGESIAMVRIPPPCASRCGLAPVNDGFAFLHGRTTPAGTRLLIAADFFAAGGQLALEVRVLRPAGLRPPSRLLQVGQGSMVAYAARGGPMRVFSGQPDPTDPSRFTIAFESGGKREVIEGKLVDPTVIPTSNEQVAYCGNALGYHVYLRPTPEP